MSKLQKKLILMLAKKACKVVIWGVNTEAANKVGSCLFHLFSWQVSALLPGLLQGRKFVGWAGRPGPTTALSWIPRVSTRLPMSSTLRCCLISTNQGQRKQKAQREKEDCIVSAEAEEEVALTIS